MRQFKHKISIKKLQKQNLTAKQIQHVYSFKTKEKQEAQARRYASSVKANRVRKFYSTGLGRWVLERRLNKIEQLHASEKWKTLSDKEKAKYEKKYVKTQMQILNSRIKHARTPQHKQDLIEAKQHKLEMLKARINAGEKAYFIGKSKAQSYSDNGTFNTTVEDYVNNHYPNELQMLMDEDKLSYDEAIQRLWEEAIMQGDIQPLAQGSGYGYTNDDTKEVISPV